MATLTCDVNEEAAATSSVTLGLTEVLAQIGRAVSGAVLAVSTLLGGSAALATSTATVSAGPELVSSAVATSTAPSQLRATLVAPSTGKASSWAIYGLGEDVDEAATASGGVRYVEPSGEGPGAVVMLIGRTTSAASTGAAASSALVGARAYELADDRAKGSSGLFGYTDLTLGSTGAAGSALVLSTSARAVLAQTGAATSSVVLTGARAELVTSAGVAASTVLVAPGIREELAVSAVVARSYALLVATMSSAWVMNTESGGMTRYTDLPVQSMAVVGGKVLALGEGGLYEFAGDTDAGVPITSSVLTGRLTLGSAAVKRLGDMIVSYSATGPMQLRVHVYGGANQGAYTYAMLPRAADAPRANRMKVGKGLVSKFWQFEWFGVGTRFDVTDVTVDVAPSTNRRI